SNLSEEIICRTMRGLVTTLVINLGSKYEKYDIDFHDLSLIIKVVKDRVEPTLYRAMNNGERSYLNTINKRIEAYSEQQSAPNKKGMLGLI
ncbi:unnamed protein product, partial [marine sediment metagenome]